MQDLSGAVPAHTSTGALQRLDVSPSSVLPYYLGLRSGERTEPSPQASTSHRHGAILSDSQNPCVSLDSCDPQFAARTTLRTTNRQLKAASWLWLGAPGGVRHRTVRVCRPLRWSTV